MMRNTAFASLLTCILLAFAGGCTEKVEIRDDVPDEETGMTPEPDQDKEDSIIGPGSVIILESGKTYREPILLEGIDASADPIIIRSSGEEPATIDAAGYGEAILIRNCSGVKISNIHIIADGKGGKSWNDDTAKDRKMRCGILVDATVAGNFRDIEISDVCVEHVFFHDPGYKQPAGDVGTANGNGAYGWGIRVMSSTAECRIAGVRIDGCKVSDVGHTGIKFTGKEGSITQVEVSNCVIDHTGGPGMQMGGVRDVHVHHNTVDCSGSPDDGRKWGRGSGYWCWGASDILLEHNSFTHANGPADSAGAHIDFNCSDVVLQYNFSAYNAGGFVEILGNCRNCCYRYNISVDDGHRVKGVNHNKQDGKTLWLSGYCGSGSKRKGPYFSYIYNNTIYVSEKVQSKLAFENSLSKALVMNNIFHIAGNCKVVKGDQNVPEIEGESTINGLVIDNNLYLHEGIMPAVYPNSHPLFGNPAFAEAGGNRPSSYIPSDRAMILQGKAIEKLAGDPVGLKIGLEVSTDFFGKPLDGNIMGAVACAR